MSIESCYNDISRLQSLKSNLQSANSDLRIATYRFTPITYNLSANYRINDSETPITQRVKRLHNDIASTNEYISNVVIPAIDDAINGKRNEIERLEAEQRAEEERRRREKEEEEERKRRENK